LPRLRSSSEFASRALVTFAVSRTIIPCFTCCRWGECLCCYRRVWVAGIISSSWCDTSGCCSAAWTIILRISGRTACSWCHCTTNRTSSCRTSIPVKVKDSKYNRPMEAWSKW
jgi:hypothetical protein